MRKEGDGEGERTRRVWTGKKGGGGKAEGDMRRMRREGKGERLSRVEIEGRRKVMNRGGRWIQTDKPCFSSVNQNRKRGKRRGEGEEGREGGYVQ